jgi:hypothetical protein
MVMYARAGASDPVPREAAGSHGAHSALVVPLDLRTVVGTIAITARSTGRWNLPAPWRTRCCSNKKIHDESRGTYGWLRVHAELTLGLGMTVNHERVARLLREADVQGLCRRRRREPRRR